jgi:hypothetical protein
MTMTDRTPDQDSTPTTAEHGHSAATTSQPLSESVPTESIASRAYDIFLQRGSGDGGDVDDWLRAERELSDGRNGQRES